MIALASFRIDHEKEASCYGNAPSPIGATARTPVAEVRLTVLASGPDLDKLLAMLAAMMPDVTRRAAEQGHAVVPALPPAPLALSQGPVVVDGVLEEP